MEQMNGVRTALKMSNVAYSPRRQFQKLFDKSHRVPLDGRIVILDPIINRKFLSNIKKKKDVFDIGEIWYIFYLMRTFKV